MGLRPTKGNEKLTAAQWKSKPLAQATFEARRACPERSRRGRPARCQPSPEGLGPRIATRASAVEPALSVVEGRGTGQRTRFNRPFLEMFFDRVVDGSVGPSKGMKIDLSFGRHPED
jgi:hypothetical protein